MTNRLKLNFSLNSIEERTSFIQNYLNTIDFIPTEDELEMMGNYVLWGKESDGKSPVQKKSIEITSRNSVWAKPSKSESLDALLEIPTFNEGLVRSFSEPPDKQKPQTFSRSEALSEAPAHLKDVFNSLFLEIDTIELITSYYDEINGKRTKPIRKELLNLFSDEKQIELKKKATSLTQRTYLKLRHLLVELRQQQFTLRDFYRPTLLQKPTPRTSKPNQLVFEADIPVYPLGLSSNHLIFKPFSQLTPDNFTYNELKQISLYYWEKRDEEALAPSIFFDYREPEHIYNLFLQFDEIQEEFSEKPFDSTIDQVLSTLNYYISITELTPIYQEILQLKIDKVKNQRIAAHINKKYGKSYSANYISTIFRQKIIKQICEAVTYHSKIIENLAFPENFKKCTSCGRTLLKDSYNFVKKSRAKDGFSNKCKCCDKKEREEKKEIKNG